LHVVSGATLLIESLTAGPGVEAVLDGLSLEVAAGRRAALLGPSGSGKTTVLKCVAGLLAPRRGRISIGGRVVADERIAVPPARRGVAMVFQSYALWPHLTAREHVRLVARDDEAADEWLERARIPHLADRPPGRLSGGEQARLALARAFAAAAPLVLLDEPLRNLDPPLAADLRDEMRRWVAEAKTTLLLVTHDLREAHALCDVAHVLLRGKIAASGTPDALRTTPPDPEVARVLGVTAAAGSEAIA
jgi:iron(III) transport system ATP-binding protein